MSLYDKRDDFPFRVQNYPHLGSNVPCTPMYGVYISQLLRFARACDRYSDFLTRHKRLVWTLLDQGFRYGLLCRKFKQFYRFHHSLIQRYSHSVTQHLREGVDSQVRWWRIRILLVGAAWLAPTDYQFTLSLVFPWLFPPSFYFFSFYSV